MLKLVLAVCTALLLVASPAISASAVNFDALPTGPRAAFLNGLIELSPSVNAIIIDQKVISGQSSGPEHVFVMSIIDKSDGVQNAAAMSITLDLAGKIPATITLPDQALVVMTDIGTSCVHKVPEIYDYPGPGNKSDRIVLSYCP